MPINRKTETQRRNNGLGLKQRDVMLLNENEDVMKRFYGVLTNGCAPSLLDCTSKEKNKGKITEQPFIFIGLKQTDDEKTRDVIAEIRRYKFKYYPVYEKRNDDYIPYFYVLGGSNEDLTAFAKQIAEQFGAELADDKAVDWHYVNPPPQCYSERHVRSLKGEVFLLR